MSLKWCDYPGQVKGTSAEYIDIWEWDMYLWTDERNIPEWLLSLLEVPEIPEELQKEIQQAHHEIEEQGAVTYSTKARVEYYLHHHHDYLSSLFKESES